VARTSGIKISGSQRSKRFMRSHDRQKTEMERVAAGVGRVQPERCISRADALHVGCRALLTKKLDEIHFDL
jgi:hypothetical protein